ncbi:TPA: hypothetical protein JBB06_04870 [Legionella pneumophila subsp. pneumophila]|uniref:Uncharacterized protein n=1 Tax=Legionella pneumophila (strain Lens) TaxID=297245 RepID=Q5WTV2_LEGPL|nr:hypothetical protein [Legionella pneumophila]AOW51022.1 hypothetical protein BE841_00410 [Legionella pneumophila subsp. pneumophila]AOW55377.1 hypothetical protein BE842_08345 [Legionella pneumophila subsp. pneumophila]AOW59073.1 hypothetical protein BE843_12785 [Legionella pneumophila subsp. pneumophila]AOW60738.1 hypothetical protein BE844_05985 [Legionella pneumophila subsp. pneumophila]AOW64529.1 hypothetical protein BE845_10870 [Legionella pneumophila subsp. pneumophila]
MGKFLVFIGSILLFFSSVLAGDIPEVDIQDQQSDQELCAQKFYNQCINKCEKTNYGDCTQACEENAKNQCLYAGE